MAADRPINPKVNDQMRGIKNIPPEERKALARRARAMIRWPAHPYGRRFQTPAAMEEAMREYFETCASIARPYTSGGLLTFMGMTRDNMTAYRQGRRGDDDEMREQFAMLCATASQVIETSKQEMALIGIYNAAFAQFDLKHNHGWKDKHEVDNTSSDGSMHVRRTIVDPKEQDEEEPED